MWLEEVTDGGLEFDSNVASSILTCWLFSPMVKNVITAYFFEHFIKLYPRILLQLTLAAE